MSATSLCLGVAWLCFFFRAVDGGSGTNGNWGQWGSWTSCSVTCGQGTSGRSRYCDSPAPSGGGLNCTGAGEETESCEVMSYCLPSYYGNADKNCTGSEFGCATGVYSCIDVDKRCDGTVDCEDGSDENSYYTGCSESTCQNFAVGLRSGMSAILVMLLMRGFILCPC